MPKKPEELDMCCLSLLIPLSPLLYVPVYLFVERRLSHLAIVQYMLKIFTVLAGIFLTIYACTTKFDFGVYLPAKGGGGEVPASIFLVILGVALMTLPLYSRYITLSNKGD